MITLQISKIEKNKDYKNPKDRDYRVISEWSLYKETNILSVAITEEQFEAIRKAVLEVF